MSDAADLYAIAKRVPASMRNLTAGKPYAATPTGAPDRASIVDDEGDTIRINCSAKGCIHLSGGTWTIKRRSKLTPKQKESLAHGEKTD